MKRKIFFSIFLCAIAVMLITAGFITSVFYVNYQEDLIKQVDLECEYLKDAAEAIMSKDTQNSPSYLPFLKEAGEKTDNRITLILSDGSVCYDNNAKAEEMENHLHREEIIQASEEGSGSFTRDSATLGTKTYYRAVKLSDGSFLRIAHTSLNLFGILGSALIWILFILVFVIIGTALAARALTRSIIKPINAIDLDKPLSGESYEELAPLLGRMEKQREKIEGQLRSLSRRQREFDCVTENMSEGLVIFGEKGTVLSVNASAKRIFSLSRQPSTYLELCRDPDYISTVESAISKGESVSGRIRKNDRIYRLSAAGVKSGENDYAAVLFIVDVTEGELDEQRRREFSANVSHELKTPLTSIMGYAEIIEKGIAKEKDIPEFTGKIREEAARLLNLIEDIIKLSRLDEGDLKAEFKPVELPELVKEIVAKMRDKAKNAGVEISADIQDSQEDSAINGFKPVLYEMIYNLCDNAIAYNKPGGSVTITLIGKTLIVKDTGIGIAPEDRDRVFERFYRVDKSHSKETGGTGLGLSIVKHGAMLHNAGIDLKSNIGKGTEIRLEFK